MQDIRIFHLPSIFSETFLAFFTSEGHIKSLQERVGNSFGMAFSTVEPSATAWRSDGDLCVENMFTGERDIVRAQTWKNHFNGGVGGNTACR